MFATTLLYTVVNLFLLALLASPILFLLRRRIGRFVSGQPWQAAGLLVALIIPVGACTHRQQLYAPLVTYSGPAANHWIVQAVKAPTREERIKHVRRVALQSEYGGHIAWQSISKVPDKETRCDLYAIVMDTPAVRSTGNVRNALKDECAK
jgi:hypothetical protein